MKGSITSKVCALAIAAALAACASPAPEKTAAEQNSGFLQDYSRLTWGKDAKGNEVRTWASSKLSPSNYNAVLLEPLIFYPEPKATEQVSAGELTKMVAYANEALRRELDKRFVLVNQPQPGAIRLRGAISGVVAQEEGLSAYQYVPIAFVATMASRAVSGTPQRAFVLSESEVTDSTTGEALALRVKAGTGAGGKLKELSGKQQLTLEMVKPLIDELAAAALPDLEKGVKPKAK